MKKVSLFLGMVLTASFAIAQTAVINQTSGVSVPPSLQTATVIQTGNNAVNITQNTEKITLENAPVKFDHVAAATQSGGDGNQINISQIAEEHINGGTYNNVAAATQVGKNNIMNQTQISGNWTSGGMNFTSYQEGEGNNGTQFGKKTESDFDLYQNGKENISNQSTTGEKTGVLVGNVRQVGTSNNATQLFHGENVRWAGGIINQEGTSNVAVQEFTGAASGHWNDPSSAEIIQRNSNNYAYQSQVGVGSYQKTEQYGNGNNAYLYSNGNFNTAYAKQDGQAGFIKIEQKQTTEEASTQANGNLAKVYQNGESSDAYVLQDGFRNKVLGLSGEDYAINNNGSYLNVSQTGVDNIVRSQQTASGAAETVVQIGTNNTSVVNQY